jgi:hypothetical protein
MTLLGYKLIGCKRDGQVHTVLEVYDADATGFSMTASKLGWMQTNHSGGRAYVCPECHSKAWEGQTDDMGR